LVDAIEFAVGCMGGSRPPVGTDDAAPRLVVHLHRAGNRSVLASLARPLDPVRIGPEVAQRGLGANEQSRRNRPGGASVRIEGPRVALI